MQRLLLFPLLCASLFASATAASVTVWQIGQSDQKYDEFAIARNYGAFHGRFDTKPLVYEIGRSEPAKDWPFIHPSTWDGWAEGRPHPFTIRFPLKETPRGLFRLRVEFVDVHAGSPPTMVVKVGDHAARLTLLPGGGDASLGNPAVGKPQKLELAMPASFFQQGVNDLELTTVDGSWLLYDAVTFLNDPDVDTSQPEIQSVTVEPTPLYLRENGQVRRVLNVKATLSTPSSGATITVGAGGDTREVQVKDWVGFSGINQEVSVLDKPDPFDATVTVVAGNATKSVKTRIEPGIRWKIFLAASGHTDIGYTDLQPACAERHNRNTDMALQIMEKDPAFKWNLEVAWQAENYLATRKGADLDRFLRFAREGRLGVQSLYCNLLTALCSHEAACRSTWYAHTLKTQYGIPYRSAMITDVPTQEATIPMLLANSGIRYFSSGINNDRAYPFTTLQDRCPFWWEGPDGSRVLMMSTWQYAQATQWGLTRNVETARTRIMGKIMDYEQRKNYPYDAIWLHGALGDNESLGPELARVVQEWNERYESPKLILCQNAEFYEYMEKRYGSQFPVFRGSPGAYWEDGAGSSAAETKLCRNAEQQVANAEKLMALARQVQPQVSYASAQLDEAWRNCLLYDEHTWGAHCSISQPDSDFTRGQWEIKARFATDAASQAESLERQSAKTFASLVKTDGRSLVVINSASWPRTDVVQVRLPEGMGVVDKGVESWDGPQGTTLLVRNVPAGGYRALKLGPSKAKHPAVAAEGTLLESRFYRIRFDAQNGAITSLWDKKEKRELVDPKAPYRLNQYLYVTGGNGSRIVMNERGPEPSLVVSVPEKATLHRERLGTLGERMTIETSATMTPNLITEVTVWNDLARVDIVNRFTKKETNDKEAVYFAFPFSASQPTFRYQCPVGIVNANRDMLPGACLDWFSVQQFVEIESTDNAIVWASPDAPLVCFQDINRGRWLRELPMKTGHLYAYVMNNYWHTNYKARQGGTTEFRFSISSRSKASNTASSRFGWETSNPLIAVAQEGNAAGLLPADSSSLVEVLEPNVLLVGTRQSAKGKGLILRLWEVSGRAATAHVRLRHFPVRSATACNLVEEPQGSLQVKDQTVSVPLRGSGLATVLVE